MDGLPPLVAAASLANGTTTVAASSGGGGARASASCSRQDAFLELPDLTSRCSLEPSTSSNREEYSSRNNNRFEQQYEDDSAAVQHTQTDSVRDVDEDNYRSCLARIAHGDQLKTTRGLVPKSVLLPSSCKGSLNTLHPLPTDEGSRIGIMYFPLVS